MTGNQTKDINDAEELHFFLAKKYLKKKYKHRDKEKWVIDKSKGRSKRVL